MKAYPGGQPQKDELIAEVKLHMAADAIRQGKEEEAIAEVMQVFRKRK